jgi:superfamily I DNA/RNA helicase
MKNVTYINAGAGSGKTHTLTQTLTDLIKEGKVKPEQVILTTFTTKAANEFKERQRRSSSMRVCTMRQSALTMP